MTLLSRRVLHEGRIGSFGIDRVELPSGRHTTLEVLRHPGAAAAVVFIGPDTIVLLRQYRHAAGGWLWEIPAGRLDPGERDRPERCAHRELKEETGCTAATMRPLLSIVTTPGFSDEVIHLFQATGLTRGAHAREPDEFMELHELPMSEIRKMIQDNEITDAKTLAGLLFVQCYISTS